MDTEEKSEIFTERIVAGSRNYFFDVKETKDGMKYLVISESKQSGSKYEHNRVMVFEEHLEAFTGGLQKALQFLGVKMEAYNFKIIRQIYPKAYERWTPDEDERLKKNYQDGMEINELATTFQRKPGAIRSRLEKLGLLPVQNKVK